MRDRLIELILKCEKENDVLACYHERPKNIQAAEIIADHLLANGVIAPPCKAGDIIYLITYNRKDYIPIKVPSLESLVRWMDEDRFGYDLFLTREEAEQALKGECNAEIH